MGGDLKLKKKLCLTIGGISQSRKTSFEIRRGLKMKKRPCLRIGGDLKMKKKLRLTIGGFQ